MECKHAGVVGCGCLFRMEHIVITLACDTWKYECVDTTCGVPHSNSVIYSW